LLATVNGDFSLGVSDVLIISDVPISLCSGLGFRAFFIIIS
jgi:hypothetical protein